MTDLSIIIPARGEEFLQRTIDDLLQNIEGNTEIIAVLDGYLPNPPLKPDPRVTIIYNPESKGQRVATNQGAKLAKGKYLMKVDAHCAFDKGIDVKMMADMQPNWTLVPMMKNLHAFDWICPDGHRRYQGPSGPCEWKFNGKEWILSEKKHNTPTDKVCGKPTIKDVVWIVKNNPTSTTYRFDRTMHFQYWGELGKRQQGDIVDTMSIQGSCFMVTREKYFELDLNSEEFNSWGQQGVEVACKTWLSGGEVKCTKKTWYCHMFRTQGGDFGFPYHNPESKINENRELSRKMFQYDGWPKAVHKFQWLLDKFNPPDWQTTKGMIYYTDNELPEKLAKVVQDNLRKIANDRGMKIVCSSLKRMDFGDVNIHFPSLKRSFLAMAKQIMSALEHSDADWVYFCEHDVLYSPEHFDYTPPTKDRFYYNINFWKLRLDDGFAIHFDAEQLSGLVADRQMLLEEYKKIYAFIEKNGFSYKTVSFEPGSRDGRSVSWRSTVPIVDIRHGHNATRDRWSQDEFRDKSTCQGWLESDTEIPGWPPTQELIKTLQ